MNPFVTSLLFALGSGAWVYNKAMKYNGGLTQKALIVAGMVGVIGMVVFYTIFASILK